MRYLHGNSKQQRRETVLKEMRKNIRDFDEQGARFSEDLVEVFWRQGKKDTWRKNVGQWTDVSLSSEGITLLEGNSVNRNGRRMDSDWRENANLSVVQQICFVIELKSSKIINSFLYNVLKCIYTRIHTYIFKDRLLVIIKIFQVFQVNHIFLQV